MSKNKRFLPTPRSFPPKGIPVFDFPNHPFHPTGVISLPHVNAPPPKVLKVSLELPSLIPPTQKSLSSDFFRVLSPIFPPPLTSKDIKVTVIIGHRGRSRLFLLIHTLKALRQQTINCLIIVVEQDSFPYCRSEIEPLCDLYLFTYSDHLYNRGWAFNCGSNFTDTEYLLLHDNDLITPPDFLSKIIPAVNSFDVLIPWGSIDYLDSESTVQFPVENSQILYTLTNNNAKGGSLLISRKFYHSVGGFDERFEGWGAEDDAFYSKICRLGKINHSNPVTGAKLLHLFHPNDNRNHNNYNKNSFLSMKYSRATPTQLRNWITDQSEIGDPQKYSKFLKLPKNQPPRVLPKKHVHIIYDVPGWAYWYRAEALRENAPSDWKVTRSNSLPYNLEQSPPDIVFLLNYGQAQVIRNRLLRRSPNTILVGSLNTGWPRRSELIPFLSQWCHHIIINNREMYLKSGAIPGTSTISNGVNLKIFRPQIPYSHRPKKVLWTSSQFHADLKGHTILREIKPQLIDWGWDLEIHLVDSHGKKKSHEEMAQWYNKGRIFLVISESEGTPNPALEASACGTPVVGTKVGNLPELITSFYNGIIISDRDPATILSGIESAISLGESLSTNVLDTIQSWDWGLRSRSYFELFDTLLRGETPSPEWNVPLLSVVPINEKEKSASHNCNSSLD